MTGYGPVPHGYAEIVRLCGDPLEYLRDDGSIDPVAWEAQLRLVHVPFPTPMPLSWQPTRNAKSVRVHPSCADRYASVFRALEHAGLWREAIRTFGGGFAIRTQRGAELLSTHAFGLSVDFDPLINRQGTKGVMSQDVVQIFEAHGMTWGGRWRGDRIDPMHFSASAGY